MAGNHQSFALLDEGFGCRDLPTQGSAADHLEPTNRADDIRDLLAIGRQRSHRPQRLIHPGRVIAIERLPE